MKRFLSAAIIIILAVSAIAIYRHMRLGDNAVQPDDQAVTSPVQPLQDSPDTEKPARAAPSPSVQASIKEEPEETPTPEPAEASKSAVMVANAVVPEKAHSAAPAVEAIPEAMGPVPADEVLKGPGAAQSLSEKTEEVPAARSSGPAQVPESEEKASDTGASAVPAAGETAQEVEPAGPGGLPETVTPGIPVPTEIAVPAAFTVMAEEEKTRPAVRPLLPSERRIAILPFENLTPVIDAEKIIRPLLMRKIRSMGYETVDSDDLRAFLCSEGVREMSRLPTGIARKAGKELSFNFILAGAVVSYVTEKRPEIGIVARMTDASTGRVLWADHVSVTGDDHITLLGLGKVDSMESLFPKVMDKLFASFNPKMLESPHEPLPRIAVLPFRNISGEPYAATIAAHLFTVNLFKSGRYEPVDPGDVRRMLVDLRIRQRGELSYRDLDAFSATFGTNYLIVGMVESYKKAKPPAPPRVSISARLLDTRRNRILWYNSIYLTGEDRIIAFDWGRLRTTDMVADAVVRDFIKRMEKNIVTTRIADSYYLEISRKD
jgi:TolB-like protein